MCIFWFYSSLSSRTCSCRDARNRPSTPLRTWKIIWKWPNSNDFWFCASRRHNFNWLFCIGNLLVLFLYRHGQPCRSFQLVLWELFSFVTLLLFGKFFEFGLDWRFNSRQKIGGEFQPENENVRRPCYRIVSSCIFNFFFSFFLVPIKCLKFLFLSLPAHIFSLFFFKMEKCVDWQRKTFQKWHS